MTYGEKFMLLRGRFLSKGYRPVTAFLSGAFRRVIYSRDPIDVKHIVRVENLKVFLKFSKLNIIKIWKYGERFDEIFKFKAEILNFWKIFNPSQWQSLSEQKTKSDSLHNTYPSSSLSHPRWQSGSGHTSAVTDKR